jgi:hypothetical protein
MNRFSNSPPRRGQGWVFKELTQSDTEKHRVTQRKESLWLSVVLRISSV